MIQYQMHALELVRNHIHYQNTYILLFIILRASLTAQTVKASACNAGDLGSIPGSGRSHGKGNGNLSTPVLLPGRFHSCLVGYSPWGLKESD